MAEGETEPAEETDKILTVTETGEIVEEVTGDTNEDEENKV
jgi:hypothetical protein